MWNLKNKIVNITTTTKSRLRDVENKVVVISREREEGRGKAAVGDSRYKSLGIK